MCSCADENKLLLGASCIVLQWKVAQKISLLGTSFETRLNFTFLFSLTKPGTNSYFYLKPPFCLKKSCLEHCDVFTYWFLLKSALFNLCYESAVTSLKPLLFPKISACFNSDCPASKCWPPVTCYLSSLALGSCLCLEEKYQWKPLTF